MEKTQWLVSYHVHHEIMISRVLRNIIPISLHIVVGFDNNFIAIS